MNFKQFLLSSVVTAGIIGFGAVGESEAANKTASDDYIIINKTYNKLAWYQDKKLKAVYPVATGRTSKLTPEGKFKIAQKLVNRPYYKDGIKGGDPRNPLGNRWLGIAVPGKSPAASWGGEYAIHGNNDPSSIGKYVSGGCIRMHDKDVEGLYPQVLMNTPVYITSSTKSFAALTNDLGYIKGESLFKATFTSFIDSSSFKVKTSKGYKVIRYSSKSQVSGLKKNQSYFFRVNEDSKGKLNLKNYSK